MKPLLVLAARNRIPIVSGTTEPRPGSTGRARSSRRIRSGAVGAEHEGLGVQVLDGAGGALPFGGSGAGFDVEIVEIHHRRKVDAPSGTAKRLADAVRKVRPASGGASHGRDGDVGSTKPTKSLAVFGVRGGDVIGDHTVFLLGSGERIELSHRASSRAIYSPTAPYAPRNFFEFGKKPGRYTTIADVLG